MSRLLVSWIALKTDFLTNEQGGFAGVNPQGPNVGFHRRHFAHLHLERHVLLYANAKQENYAEHLAAALRREFPARIIDSQLLELHDVIDLAEVKTKVETWLLAGSAELLPHGVQYVPTR